MSKSFGNTIDPHKCLDTVPADTFRYYLIRETPYGADMSFSEDAMKLVHNSDLADSLGNLFSRAVAMCAKYTGGKVPEEKSEGSFNLEKTVKSVEKAMGSYELHKMAEACILSVHDVNKYLTDREPWKMKDEKKRASVVRTILESCYYFAHLFAPMCPVAAENMVKTLNVEMRPLKELSIGFDNLSSGHPVGKASVLFPKLIDEDKDKKAKAAAAKGGKKKGNKGGGKKKKTQSDPNQNIFTQVDIRVGKIVKVWEHEGSDKLFCEEIDVGEGKPRQIASGLRAYYKLDDLQDRKVLVVCNLKKAKLAGFDSEGMVLCASADGKTEFVDPPADAKIGENVKIDGLTGDPVGPNQMKKRKIWSKVQPGLKTNADRVACWEGKIILTSAGPCTASSVVGGGIK